MSNLLLKWKRTLAFILAMMFVLQPPVTVLAENEEAGAELLFLDEVLDPQSGAVTASDVIRGNGYTEDLYWYLDGGDLFISATSSYVSQPATGSYYGTLDPRVSYAYGKLPWASHSSEILSVTVGGEDDIVVPFYTSNWFSGLENLQNVFFEGIDTSGVEKMNGMFSGCTWLNTLDLSALDTSMVTDMSEMFKNCEFLEVLELDNFDTSLVTDFSGMFRNCSKLVSLDISMFEFESATTMESMFSDCTKLAELSLPFSLNTHSVVNFSYLCKGCEKLDIFYFSNLETDSAVYMTEMFMDCKNNTGIYFNSFNLKKVKDMSGMFRGNTSLETFYADEISAAPALKSVKDMFRDCSSLKTLDLSALTCENLTDLSGLCYGCTSLESVWLNKIVNILPGRDLHDMFRDCVSLTSLDLRNETDSSPQENVIVVDGSYVTDMSGMLKGCSGLESLQITMNMKNVPNVADMLAGCTGLKSFTKGINCRLTGYKTATKANLPNPSADFVPGADGYWYTTLDSTEQRLTSDQLGDTDSDIAYRAYFGSVKYNPNGYSVEPVVDYLKYGENYKVRSNVFPVTGTLVSWNKNAEGKGTKYDLNTEYDPVADGLINTTLYAIWQDKPAGTVKIEWQNYDGSVLESKDVQIGTLPEYTGEEPRRLPEGTTIWVFTGWDKEIAVAAEDCVYTAQYDERPNGRLTVTFDPDNGEEPQVLYVKYGYWPTPTQPAKTVPGKVCTFTGWTPELNYAYKDMTYKAVYSITDEEMLYWQYEDGNLYIGNAYTKESSSSGAFSLNEVFSEENPAPWYKFRKSITAVTVVASHPGPVNMDCWFMDLEYLTDVQFGSDFSNTVSMHGLFENCRRLKSLDLRFVTGEENVRDFSDMFKGCSSLTDLKFGYWYTTSATNLSGMFDGMIRIKTLDITFFKTSGVTDFSRMFNDCRYLENLNVRGLDTSNAVSMEKMFAGCRSLTNLNVSGFSTAKAVNLNSMFENCSRIGYLDLTGFTVDSAVTTTDKMFSGMTYLEGFKTGPVGDFTKASLPAPDGNVLEGAHGYWIGTDDYGYAPKYIPVNKQDTYRVLYAKVYYDSNGAGGERVMDYLKCSSSYYGIKANPYTAPEGKYFAGWTLTKGETTKVYKAGQALTKAEADLLKNEVLYAKWEYIVTPTASVTWRDAKGDIIRVDKNVEYGTTPSFGGTPPAKESDAEFSYTFSNWKPAIKPVDGDIEYSPVYSKTTRTYTVTWCNYDGKVLQTNKDVPYGTKVTYQGTEPKRASDSSYTYQFKGWSPEVKEIKGDTVYWAAFSKTEIPTVNTYTVTWLHSDNKTVLYEQKGVAEGTIPTYSGPEPTIPSDDTYTYSFTGWDPKVGKIMKDTTYVAKFSRNLRDYLVTYEANGHGKTKTVRTYVGTKLSPPANPEAEGWIFTGWYTTSLCVTKVDFDTYLMPAKPVTVYAGWKRQYSGGGGGGGGGGGTVKSITLNKNAGGSTFSANWKQNAAGQWYITDGSGAIVRSSWLCDDAVVSNRSDVWYLLKEDGTMLDAGLVRDNTGNYYSLEMEHNGYYGKLRTQDGWYNGVYLEFERSHNGSFGAIKNQDGIEALKAKFGVTVYNIGNENCVYSSSF